MNLPQPLTSRCVSRSAAHEQIEKLMSPQTVNSKHMSQCVSQRKLYYATERSWGILVHIALALSFLLTSYATGAIYRWDNGEQIPGTLNLTARPLRILNKKDLAYADFGNADLTSARFSEVNLSHSDLSNATLYNFSGDRVDLSHATLVGTNLKQSRISDSDLTGANLTDADLMGRILGWLDNDRRGFYKCQDQPRLFGWIHIGPALFNKELQGPKSDWRQVRWGIARMGLFRPEPYRGRSVARATCQCEPNGRDHHACRFVRYNFRWLEPATACLDGQFSGRRPAWNRTGAKRSDQLELCWPKPRRRQLWRVDARGRRLHRRNRPWRQLY